MYFGWLRIGCPCKFGGHQEIFIIIQVLVSQGIGQKKNKIYKANYNDCSHIIKKP